MKTCKLCGRNEDETAFRPMGGRICRSCGRAKQNEQRQKDPRKTRAQRVQWRLNDPVGRLIYAARCRAKRRGLEFSIRSEDLELPKACPILGIPITPATGYRKDGSPSLHRINSTIGYILGNVAIVSWRANCLIGDATFEELLRLEKWMEANEDF